MEQKLFVYLEYREQTEESNGWALFSESIRFAYDSTLWQILGNAPSTPLSARGTPADSPTRGRYVVKVFSRDDWFIHSEDDYQWALRWAIDEVDAERVIAQGAAVYLAPRAILPICWYASWINYDKLQTHIHTHDLDLEATPTPFQALVDTLRFATEQYGDARLIFWFLPEELNEVDRLLYKDEEW